MRVERDERLRLFGKAGRRRWPGWALGLAALSLAWASARAEGPSGEAKLDIGGNPIQLSYSKHEIRDYGTPEETHWIVGEPASATAVLEGATVVLVAPSMSYRAQAGLFSATSGVRISDGTLAVEARQGRFDMAGREAHFEGEVHWQRRQRSGELSRGDNEFITLRFGRQGVEHIVFGSAPERPGRMFLFPEKGAMERFQSGEEERERRLPEAPRIERALAPLEP